MPGDLLKDYLIALGFNIKDEQYRKFQAGVARSTKEVAGLGATAIGTAAAIGYMVEKAARNYEDLYYASQRTGRSVVALKAYEFASRMVGVSAETARGQTEAFYATLRTNPGMRGLLANLGGDEAAGPGGLVASLKKKFGESGYFVASRFAQMFGIDEQSFRTYWLNVDRLAAAQADSIKRQREAGVAAEDTSGKFLAFANSVDHLQDNLQNLKTRFALDFVKPYTSVVQAIDNNVEAFNRMDKKLHDAKDTTYGGISNKSLIGRTLEYLFGPAKTADGKDDSGTAGQTAARGNTNSVIDYFTSQGWTHEQAAGIAANLYEESKFNPKSAGDNGSAYGIGQWHSDRQAEFKRRFGKDIRDSTLEEQMSFVQYELTQGREQSAGFALRKARTAEEAGSVVSRLYERPAAVAEAATNRAQLARQFVGGGTTLGDRPEVEAAIDRGRQMVLQAQSIARIMGANLGPAPSAVASSALIINHDTDINLYGNADKAAVNNIVDAQGDVYSQAVRNNLPRTR